MTQQMKHLKTSLVTTDDGNEDNRQQIRIYAKNSMDRFGDDLYGLILSYLLIEDRFQCECVSKQFQRTVFESVVDINLSNKFLIKILCGRLIDTQMLATITTKCPNIQTIDCRRISNRFDEYIPEVLNTFRNNCGHLREIYATLWQMNCKHMHSIKPLVTRISYIKVAPDLMFNECTPRFWSLIKPKQQLLLNNLHTIEFNEYSAQNNRLLAAFAAQNQCLRCVVIHSFERPFNDTVVEFGRQLSRLTQLRELRLSLVLMKGKNSLNDFLLTIGLNCKQLKRLSLELESYNKLSGNLLDSLSSYHSLKRLRLTLYAAINHEVLEPLKLCHRLTHLTLNVREMSDQLLDNCGKHWPRLQYLSIRANAMKGKCLNNISRLPALQTLKIYTCFLCYDSLNYNLIDLLSRSPKLNYTEIHAKNTFQYFYR